MPSTAADDLGHAPAPSRPLPADAARPCPPFWLSIAAGLPITLCMVVMGLPDIGHGRANTFRLLYGVGYLLWCLPLAALQRALWRRRASWWLAAPLLLGLSYACSVINNAAAMVLALHWQLIPRYEPARLFSGLDGCWLALIGFCAIHAVLNYYAMYRAEQERALRALALARDAELRALRYQLHPHFLFNALNAISSLVNSQRPREASRMIARLGDFLRATLEHGERHEVALAEELALAESYLAIEQARLGERLTVHMNIGPDVLDAMLPFLLLQPLIENAVRHGIAARSGHGRLELRVDRAGPWLHIGLDNDGAAADGTTPRSIPAIGLRNVRERLAALYGEAHRFDAAAQPDGSFRVRIALPLRLDPTPLSQPVGSAR
jgi:two-component system sensor histidine kinase AlgZ